MRNLLRFSVSVALKRVVNPDPFSQYLTLFYKVLGAMNTSSLPSLLENARFAECSPNRGNIIHLIYRLYGLISDSELPQIKSNRKAP